MSSAEKLEPFPKFIAIDATFITDKVSFSFNDNSIVIGPVFTPIQNVTFQASIGGDSKFKRSIVDCFRTEFNDPTNLIGGKIGLVIGHIEGEKLAKVNINPDDAKNLFGSSTSVSFKGTAIYKVESQPQFYASTQCGPGGYMYKLKPSKFIIQNFMGSQDYEITSFYW